VRQKYARNDAKSTNKSEKSINCKDNPSVDERLKLLTHHSLDKLSK